MSIKRFWSFKEGVVDFVYNGEMGVGSRKFL